MAPEGERRGGPESGEGDFKGRDLLVGRRGGAAGRPVANAAATPPATAAASPRPRAHDNAIREILETVRATAARIEALEETPGPEHETTEVLARQTAALTQAVEDARDALAKAAELAARRDGQESAGAKALADAAAALKTQGEALDQRLRATGEQAEAAAQATAEMKQAATALDNSLRIHAENMTRMTKGPRGRQWRFGLTIATASFVFFVLGVVLPRETDVVSPDDPHHEWNRFVAERYAPTLAACASRARQYDEAVRCQMRVDPLRELTIPLYPDVSLSEVSPDEDFYTTTDR